MKVKDEAKDDDEQQPKTNEGEINTVIISGLCATSEDTLWRSLMHADEQGKKGSILDDEVWGINFVYGVQFVRNKSDASPAGYAFMGFRDKEVKDRCVQQWDGQIVEDMEGCANVLRVSTARSDLELPPAGQGGKLGPRPGNKALPVEQSLINRDNEEARRRTIAQKEMELNLLREAQKRRAIDHGGQMELGNQYDASRSTSAGMANLMFNAMKQSGACHFC